MNTGDNVSVPMDGENDFWFLGHDVPYLDGFIKGARGNLASSGRKTDGKDEVFVSNQSFDALTSEDIPDDDGAVIRGTGQFSGIWGPGDVGDALVMANELADVLTVVGIPNVDD